MKKLVVMFVALSLSFTALSGCGSKEADETPQDSGTDVSGEGEKETKTQGVDTASGDGAYKIGGIGPLTGPNASYGLSVKQGAQVAVDEINALGGIQLELLFEDDQADGEKAVSAYNTLMDQEVTAILGAVTSDACIAVTEESQVDGILQVTPSGSAQACTQYDNGFRICFTDPLQGKTMADYIKAQGYESVAVIYDNSSDYSNGIKEAFEEQAGAIGLNVATSESFTSGDVDFKTQLTKVKSSGAQCLFLPVYYAEVAYISEQAKTVGLELPYFGCDGWDGVIAQLNGDTTNIEGAVFLTPFVATSEAENVKKFVETYNQSYNAIPDQFAADGYDGVYAIYQAISACNGDVTNENIIANMQNIEVKGLTGDMTFTKEGEPNKSALVATIENGQYVAK